MTEVHKPSPEFDRLYQKPPTDESQSHRTGKAILIILLGTAFSLFVGILVIDSSKPPLSLPDRMKRECERQFSSLGQVAVNDCVIKLMIRYSAEQQQDKLNSAYQRSR